MLAGLPFVSSIMLRILESLKTNWERIGDVRFAVTCSPGADGVFTEENARLIADEWKKKDSGIVIPPIPPIPPIEIDPDEGGVFIDILGEY